MRQDTLLNESPNEPDAPRTADEIAQELRSIVPTHPALNRLHRRLVASSEVEAVITSYDRMYHRHARS